MQHVKHPSMVGVVWRVAAADFDVAAFLEEFELEPDVVWRPGDMLGRRRRDTFGFNLSIDEEDTLEGMLKDVRAFLEEYREAFVALQTRGVSCSIDFGFQVGSQQRFVRSLEFPPDLL